MPARGKPAGWRPCSTGMNRVSKRNIGSGAENIPLPPKFSPSRREGAFERMKYPNSGEAEFEVREHDFFPRRQAAGPLF